MNLIDANIWDMANLSFYGSLYYMEQVDTIFIQIGAIWEFDRIINEKCIDLSQIVLYLENQASYEFTVIFCSLW